MSAILKNGAELPFDILVMAVGVRPNIELVKEAGGEVDRGVIVDGDGATTLPDVYAAGDCTQSQDITTGQQRVLALLPNAYMQGECAGINMAGGRKEIRQGHPHERHRLLRDCISSRRAATTAKRWLIESPGHTKGSLRRTTGSRAISSSATWSGPEFIRA